MVMTRDGSYGLLAVVSLVVLLGFAFGCGGGGSGGGGGGGGTPAPAPPALDADFVGEPLTGLAPLDVAFTDRSTFTEGHPIQVWTWSFGDGGTSTTQSPNHQYAVEGTYIVTLTVTDDRVSDTETKINYITVGGGDGGPVPSATLSTIIANPVTVPADDVSVITLTVTALDTSGQPIQSATVVLSSTGSDNTIVQPAPTDANGVTTGTLRSSRAEAKTVSASINGVAIAQTVTVTFTPVVHYRLLFLSYETGDIWTIRDDGTDVRHITETEVEERGYSWSPDGSQIVYTLSCGSGDTADSELRRVGREGGEPYAISWHPAVRYYNEKPAWGRGQSANLIAFESRVPEGTNDICILNVWGGGFRNLTPSWPADDRNPQCSPNGQWVAFESNRGDGIHYNLYKIDVFSLNLIRLTIDNTTDDHLGEWSSDGSKIIFTRRAPAENHEARMEIYTVSTDESADIVCTRLTSGGYDIQPTYSPSGAITFSSLRDGNGRYEIYVMEGDGGNLYRLFQHDGWDDLSPVWSPNGEKIAFQSFGFDAGEARQEIWVIQVGTGSVLRAVSLPLQRGADITLEWCPVPE